MGVMIGRSRSCSAALSAAVSSVMRRARRIAEKSVTHSAALINPRSSSATINKGRCKASLQLRDVVAETEPGDQEAGVFEIIGGLI